MEGAEGAGQLQELLEVEVEVVAVDQVDFAEQAEDVCPLVQHHLQLATAAVAAVSSDSVSVSLEASLLHPDNKVFQS